MNKYVPYEDIIELGGKKVWEHKLKRVLETDIHKKDLGCRILNTHVNIGRVHVNTFYEAQILFSSAYWVDKFASWMHGKITSLIPNPSNIILVGFENYSEMMLSKVTDSLNKTEYHSCYAIYENEKYFRRNIKSNASMRFSKDLSDFLTEGCNVNIVFVVGISSTMFSFSVLEDYIKNNYSNIHIATTHYLSVFQGKSKNKAFDKYLNKWDENNKTVIGKINNSKQTVHYLIELESEWYDANNCKLCYPELYNKTCIEEVPLIETDDTSVVPLQMIKPLECNTYNEPTNNSDIDLLTGITGGEEFLHNIDNKKYLYYSHIERGENHFRYYIRTKQLCSDLLNDDNNNNILKWFRALQDKLVHDDDKEVHVIISPSHFSNERFSIAVNRYVFKNRAYMIHFDVKKEYRSNFEAKYSNYATMLEICGKMTEIPNIYFHFVDDQIVSGDTYYRAKSLTESLIYDSRINLPDNARDKIKVFQSVITFINRSSKSTQRNYIEDPYYYSYIYFGIPLLRSFGDSCPICKKILRSQALIQNSALDNMAYHWQNKELYYRLKSLDEVRRAEDEPWEKERHFRRLQCENEVWKAVKNCFTEEDVEKAIISCFNIKKYNLSSNRGKEDILEDTISYIKVVSRPLIIYQEHIKKAALKIMLRILESIRNNEEDDFLGKVSKLLRREDNHPNDSNAKILIKKLNLLSILFFRISALNSNYILNKERLKYWWSYSENIYKIYVNHMNVRDESGQSLRSSLKGFTNNIRYSLKRLIINSSDDSKIKKLDTIINNIISDNWYKEVSEGCQKFFEEIIIENTHLGLYDNAIMTNQEYKDLCVAFEDKNNYHELAINISNIIKANFVAFYIKDTANDDNFICLSAKTPEVDKNFNKDKIQELEENGFFRDGNKFLVKLDNNFNRLIKDYDPICVEKYTDLQEIDTLYLWIEFPTGDNDITVLKKLRKLLSMRSKMLKRVTDDFNNNIIPQWIIQTRLVVALSEQKSATHGKNSDIIELCEIAQCFAENLLKTTLPEGIPEIKNLIKACNVLINVSIALGYRAIVQQQEGICEKITLDNIMTPGLSTDKNATNAIQLLQYMKTYFENDDYINNENDTTHIKFEFDIDESLEGDNENMEILNIYPNKDNIVTPFALINALLQNCKIHAKERDTVKVSITKISADEFMHRFGEIDRTLIDDVYDLEIVNTPKINTSDNQMRGITSKTLQHILGDKYKIKFDSNDNLYITRIKSFILKSVKENSK